MCAHFLFCFSGAEDESYGHMGSRIWLCLWVMSSANLEHFISIRIYWFICIFFFLSCLLCFLCHTHSVQMTFKSLVILKKSCQSERMHFWSLWVISIAVFQDGKVRDEEWSQKSDRIDVTATQSNWHRSSMSTYSEGWKTTTKDNLQQSQIHFLTIVKQAFKIKSAFMV